MISNYNKSVFTEVPRANGLLKIVLSIIVYKKCLLFTKMFGTVSKLLFQ